MSRKSSDKRQSLGLSGISGQVYRKVHKKGFEFCLMVVGETGLGKSTLVNALFLPEDSLDSDDVMKAAAQRIPQTVEVIPRTVEIMEKGVQLRLTIIDTPGFGDAVDNTDCWKKVVEYIDGTFEQYLHDESRVDRRSIQDDRVHACLYFINPSGRGLRPIDIEAMKSIHTKVNVVPVIAKADTLTKKELGALKEEILIQLKENNLEVFQPALDEDDDEHTYMTNLDLVGSMPFAIVGSNKIVEVAGTSTRGRVYPWGMVEVDNQDHCDFQRLRNMLVRTHLQDLKDYTVEVLYENYRKDALAARQADGGVGATTSQHVHEPAKKSSMMQEEEEMVARAERMKRELAEQERLLEEKRRQFEEERRRYEEQMKAMGQQGGGNVGNVV